MPRSISSTSHFTTPPLASHSSRLPSPYQLCRARYLRTTRKLKKCAILDSQGHYLSGALHHILTETCPHQRNLIQRTNSSFPTRSPCFANPLWNKQNDDVIPYEEDLSPVMFDNPNYRFPNTDPMLPSSERFHRLREDDSSTSEDGFTDEFSTFIRFPTTSGHHGGGGLHATTDSLCSSVTSSSSFLPPLQQPLLAVEEDDSDDVEMELMENCASSVIMQSSLSRLSLPVEKEQQVMENGSPPDGQYAFHDSSTHVENDAHDAESTCKDATPITERVIYSPCSVDSGIQSQPTSNYDLASNNGSDGWKRQQTAYKTSTEIGELAHCWEQHEVTEVATSSTSSDGNFFQDTKASTTVDRNIVTPVWAKKLAQTPNVKITMDKEHRLKNRNKYCNAVSTNIPLSSGHLHPQVHGSTCDLMEDVGRKYAVHYLGQAYLYENDVTPERSSRAVNRCIQQVTCPRRDVYESAPKWTEGNDLTLQLSDKYLVIYHTMNKTIFLRQPILGIRVWGIGHSNLHDFAYVTRDAVPNKRYICHVLRCHEVYANEIANLLCSLCRQLATDTTQQQRCTKPTVLAVKPVSTVKLPWTTKETRPMTTVSQYLLDDPLSIRPPTKDVSHHSAHKRPQDLPGLVSRQSPQPLQSNINATVRAEYSWRPVIPFSTPIDEPKHAYECRYLGTQKVSHPSGVAMLNAAIDRADAQLLSHDRELVRVLIAPSTIVIHRLEVMESVPIECRIRFLSFMSVSKRDPRLCGFVIHTVSDEFLCHVFECQPDATQLTKLIESACQLRYHMCMDARVYASSSASQTERKVQAMSSSNLATPLQNSYNLFEEKDGLARQLKCQISSSFSASTLSSLTPSTPKERVKEGFSNVFAYLGWSTR